MSYEELIADVVALVEIDQMRKEVGENERLLLENANMARPRL